MRGHILGIAALATALALGACGQPATSEGEASDAPLTSATMPEMFQTSFRLEAITRDADSGRTTPIAWASDGGKMRIEVEAGGGEQVFITDPEAGRSIAITNQNGQTMAFAISSDQVPDVAGNVNAQFQEGAGDAVRVGPCSHAGESGTEWRKEGDDEGNSACITDDGILLLVKDDGETVWETTSLERGPQDPALFAPPPGVRVMDVRNMLGPQGAEMLEKMGAQFGD